MKNNPQSLTTGEVAKLCNVSGAMVRRWVDGGILKGFRIPGSKFGRIPRKEVTEFLRTNGMLMGETYVLVVTQDLELIEGFKRELPAEKHFKVSVAPSTFDAGIRVGEFHPDCVIIDFSIGEIEALQLCKCLGENTDFDKTILFALTPDDGPPNLDLDETFRKPFDVQLVAERLRTLIGTRELKK